VNAPGLLKLHEDSLTGIGLGAMGVAAFPIVNEDWLTVDVQYFNTGTFPVSLEVFFLSV
jgi:hypothetical protein